MQEPSFELDSPVPATDETGLSRRRFVALGATGLTGVLLSSSCRSDASVPKAVTAPPVPTSTGTVRAAVRNRAPLQNVPFVALPLGSVRAKGWLLCQLELQRDGLTGHAAELLPAVKADSAWLGGKGEDWEKGPYYIKGLVPLAFTLDDPALKAIVQKWVDSILGSQREDGFFGPKTNDDWWPRMVVTYLLRDYAEATGDARVVPFLFKYYRFVAANLPARPLKEWGRARAGDEMDTVFWLYNRTGEPFLLEVADLLEHQAYPWTDILTRNRFMEFGEDFHPKHNVNVPQAMKQPPVYWQRSGKPADRAAFLRGAENLMRDHGLAVGINSGTEFLAGRSAAQGIELCSIVERMLSDETAMRILGDATIGDNLEQLAFNALPAALSTDIRQHVYFTLPNNPTAPRGRVGFTQDYEDARTPAPRSGFPCCCYNFHMGWPKLAQNAWAATKDGGLAIMAYVPSEVTALVAGGSEVRIIEETNYPFEDTIRLQVSTAGKVLFPLSLRIPAWCKNPSVTVNGKAQPSVKPGSFLVVQREWASGDAVELHFPMVVQTMPGINHSVAVWRGPLLYSLKIGEKWTAFEKSKIEGFDSYEVTPTSAWNVGLVLGERTDAAFTVQKKAMPKNPFDPAETPVQLQVSARTIPDWTLTRDGHVAFDPPVSPVASVAPVQKVTLVPFGAQMLRICNFPVIGAVPPAPLQFKEDFATGHFDNWVTYGGGWLVQNGAFGPSPDAPSSKAVATATRFRDFVYDASVAVNSTGDAGLIFRVTKASIGADDYNGYYVGLSAETGQITLGKADGKWTPLKVVAHPLAANRPTAVRVEARGATLRVFVEKMTQPILEVSDTSFVEGAIGVRQYGAKSDKPQSGFSGIAVVQI